MSDSLSSNLRLPEYTAEKLAENYPNRIDPLLLSGPYTPIYLAKQEIERLRAALSILTVGGIVASPHNRRISLSFETDEQYQQAEHALDIADEEQPVETESSL